MVSRDFGGTTQQRFDPCNQFEDRERLGKIVVAACTQSAHTIVDRAKRAQNQHGGTHLLLPQRLDDRETVHARQHPIHDHDVGVRRASLVEARNSVGAPFHLKAAIDEFGGDFFRRFAVIFDQQYLCHERLTD